MIVAAYKILQSLLTVRSIWLMALLGAIGFLIVIMARFLKQRCIRVGNALLTAVLIAYLVFILQLTLLGRTPGTSRNAMLIPLTSWYMALVQRDRQMLYEILLNILLFVPFGLVLRARKPISSRNGLLTGLCISAVIEVLQWILKLGFFEWDDMIHNALGCFLGVWMMNKIFNFCRKGKNQT